MSSGGLAVFIPQGSVQRDQPERLISQSSTEEGKKKKSLFSYIESCCQRVSLLISNFVHNQSDCDPPWTPSYEASSAISTFSLWPTPGCHVVEGRKEE